MRRYLLGLFLFLSLLLTHMQAFAAEQLLPVVPPITTVDPKNNFDFLKKQIAQAGMTYELSGNVLDIYINENQTINNNLQVAKVIEGSNGRLKSIPFSWMVYSIGLTYTAMILSVLYVENTALDELQVNGYFQALGGTAKYPCFNFGHSRALYNHLELDGLSVDDFILHTQAFEFDTWCAERLGTGKR